MALFDRIEFHSRINPEGLALVAFDTFAEGLSYGDLGHLAEAASRILARGNIASGQRVGIDCQDRLLQIAAALGLMRIGGVNVVMSKNGSFASGAVDAVVTDRPRLGATARAVVVEAGALMNLDLSRRDPARGDRRAPCSWTFSGERGALSIGESLLLTRIVQRCQAKGPGAGARWLGAVDPRTELGFSALMESLCSAGTLVLTNGKFEDDVQPIGLYQADHLLVDAAVAADYLHIFDQAGAISARVRTALVAGAIDGTQQLERFKQHVTAHTVIHLDLPETGAIAACSYWQIGSPRQYWPLPGVELRIVGGDGQVLGAEAQGEIAIRSESAVSQDGWFRSGLKGMLTAEGALVTA